MDIGDLYKFVLLIVLVGILIGVGLVVLTQFMGSSGVTGTVAEQGINSTINAIVTIPTTWLPLIVVVASLAIVLVLVLRSFGGSMQR